MEALEMQVPLAIVENAVVVEDKVQDGDDGGADTEAADGDADGDADEEVKSDELEEGKAQETETAVRGVMSTTLKIQSNLALQEFANDGRIITFSGISAVLPAETASSADVPAPVDDEIDAGVEETKISAEETENINTDAEGETNSTSSPILQVAMTDEFLSFSVDSNSSGADFPVVSCFLSTDNVSDLKRSIEAFGSIALYVNEKVVETDVKDETSQEGLEEDATDETATDETKGGKEEEEVTVDGVAIADVPAVNPPRHEARVIVSDLLEVGRMSCTFDLAELGAGGTISGKIVISKALVPVPPEPPAPELTLNDIVPERPVGLMLM